jgi:hypothetical protein
MVTSFCSRCNATTYFKRESKYYVCDNCFGCHKLEEEL